MHADFASIIEKLEQDATYLELFDQAYGSEEITEDGMQRPWLNTYVPSLVGRRILINTLKATTSLLRANSWALISSITNRRLLSLPWRSYFGLPDGSFGLLQFSNNGLDSTHEVGDGREGVTGNPNDRGKFKVPSLRNIEYSFPYMHDGRFQTLAEVVEFYNMGGHPSATLDPNMKAAGVGRNWSEAEARIDRLHEDFK